jgi:hypothetical protein
VGLLNLPWALVLLHGDNLRYLGACRDLHSRNIDRKLARPTLLRVYALRTRNESTESGWTIILSTWCFGNALVVHTTHVQSSSNNDGDNLGNQFIPAHIDLNYGGSRHRITF